MAFKFKAMTLLFGFILNQAIYTQLVSKYKEIERNNQCSLWGKLREITSKTAERTKKFVTFPTKQDPVGASLPKMIYKVNLNTQIIHNISVIQLLGSDFQDWIVWIRKMNCWSPKGVFYLMQSCSYIQLYPRSIKIHKNLSFKNHKL